MQTTRSLTLEEIAQQLAERFGAAATVNLVPATAPNPDPFKGDAVVSADTIVMLEWLEGAELRDGFNQVVRTARVAFKLNPLVLQQQFDRFPESKHPQQALTFGADGPARQVLSVAESRCWEVIRSSEDWAFIKAQQKSEPAPTVELDSAEEPPAGGRRGSGKRRGTGSEHA